MKRYDLMSSADIKAEIQRLRAEIDRPELSAAARDAAHWGIDTGLDELRKRGEL
ncbi:hypothetical protein AB0D49_08290 [Streptomyces sp. NPDC048290]|uniref:hypothetical protein n=1 Tax=Streptomyces sp. NPDC048290 TaxID=3155811 RepID=UPI00341849E4